MSPWKPSRALLLAAPVSLAALAAPFGAVAQPPRLIAPATASGEPYSFADLVQRVSPSVVSVFVEREVERPQIPSALQQFFQFRFGGPDGGQQQPFGDGGEDGGVEVQEAQGSGFFIDPAGHLVTNNHVVEGATKIEVRLGDGTVKTARLVGADPLTDLAVLKVEPALNQPYVQFADDVNLRVGDWVLAVGNPFGLGGTVTSGIVSAIGGESRSGQFLDFIQIDAPINRGNSGGPTFDVKGRVVGVNTAIYSPTGGSVGIGFAIPAKAAKETVAQLIRSGSVTRGWLGVTIQPLTDDLAKAMGRKDSKGALVADVMNGTPAANAGIMSGDIILSVNNRPVANSIELTRTVASLTPGSKAQVRLIRNSQERVIPVTLGQRDAKAEQAGGGFEGRGGGVSPAPDLSSDLGMRLQDLNPALRQQLRLPATANGVVVTAVKPGGAAANAGLRPGAVVLDVDNRSVASAAALSRVLDEARRAGKQAVVVRFQLGDQKQIVAMNLAKR